MADQNTVSTAGPQVASINMPPETLIEFLNSLHNANADGTVAANLANGLATQKILNRDPSAVVDPNAHFTQLPDLSEEEKDHLTAVANNFSAVLNAVCCHKKGPDPCLPGQDPCPGDPID